MRKRFVVIFGFLCLYGHNCLSQDKNPYKDYYLMVLDIQSQFYTNTAFDSSAKKMVLEVNSLIARFDPEKVIYIKSAGKALSISSKGITAVPLPAPDMDSNLLVVNQHIFTKCGTGNAFTVTELLNYLENNHVKKIFLVGLLAEECISKTSIGGAEKGYDMYLIPEAITGKNEKSKEKSLNKLKKKGITLIPITEIIN